MLLVLAAIAIVALIAVFLPQLWQFNDAPSAQRKDAWAEFTGYFSGLLGPVLGTLTLFAVLYAVRLHRDALAVSRAQLAGAARSELKQRLLTERNGFETGFFRLLATVDDNARRLAITLPSGRTQRTYVGPDAFPALIRGFDAKYLRPFDRGELLEQPRGVYLRNAAKKFFNEVDHQTGPYIRSLGDIFEYIKDYETRTAATAEGTEAPEIWGGPVLRHPKFYARLVTNSRTRHEMKLFAMYVASAAYVPAEGVAPPLRAIASDYDIFADTIDRHWWGRRAFVEMR